MNLRGAGLFVVAVAMWLAMAGCDRTPPPQAAQPATAPVRVAIAPPPATTPATTTATSQPANSFVQINDRMTIFPPARLRIESDGQHLVALLFTDDPKDALKDSYTGNSFYLRMELDVDNVEELAQARWHYTAPSSGDREDSPYGIYLGGKKLQLQPYDVRGAFKVDGDATAVLISGQFQVVDDSTGKGPPQLVPVAANLPVRVQSVVKGEAK
jgi:hypothetical protein